jgi:hypothetical protein
MLTGAVTTRVFGLVYMTNPTAFIYCLRHNDIEVSRCQTGTVGSYTDSDWRELETGVRENI